MKKILIIEDDAMVGKLLQVKLTQTGKYEVFRAFDGIEGMKLLDQHQPDLIVLDMAMPKKNGFEVLKELKEKYGENDKRPYVFVASNLAGEDDRKKIFDLGANDFVNKRSSTIGAIIEAIGKIL